MIETAVWSRASVYIKELRSHRFKTKNKTKRNWKGSEGNFWEVTKWHKRFSYYHINYISLFLFAQHRVSFAWYALQCIAFCQVDISIYDPSNAQKYLVGDESRRFVKYLAKLKSFSAGANYNSKSSDYR